MPLLAITISNPILNYQEDYDSGTGSRKSTLDWTYEGEVPATTPVTLESSMPPIIEVNNPDGDSEDVQITHECDL